MSWDSILDFFKTLDANGGWFYDFLSYLVAGVLILLVCVYFYRLAKGQIDWLGRSVDNSISLEVLEKEKLDLLTELTQTKDTIEQQAQTIRDQENKLKELQELYSELDSKYDDETYTTSQIMYASQEVAAAIANEAEFEKNKDDIFDHLLDYLINTLKGFREKNARIAIFIKHPTSNEHLTHYVHSSGHSPRVKEYKPPIDGSAAGHAWRTNEVYYVKDIENKHYEYHQKEKASRYYQSLLCVPIHAGPDKSTRIGVLTLTGKNANAYEKIEIERVILFAHLFYPLIYKDLQKRGEITSG